ncbi:AMPKBI domain-containing protein [Lachancea thermotolerans]
MGNNPSTANMQNKRVSQLAQEPRGRQDSITSQLFPSRTSGRNPESKVGWKSRVLHGNRPSASPASTPPVQSPFRKNYTLEATTESAPYNLKKSISGNPAPPMCTTTHASADESSSSSLRDHLAELSLQNSESQPNRKTSPGLGPGPAPAPVLRSPGPSTPVVKYTKHDAISDQVSSITSLKKMLVEGRVGDNIHPPPTSIDIPRRPSAALSDAYFSDDGDDEESLLQGTNDVVINNSVLENAMKRKRGTKKNKGVGASSESHEHISYPGLKKLKPLEHGGDKRDLPHFRAMHPRPSEDNVGPDSAAIPRLITDSLNRIDSFEKGTVEHYEGANESGFSSQNLTSSDMRDSDDADEERGPGTHVILNWKDNIVDPKTCKMSIVSKDISSTLNPHKKFSKIPMVFDMERNCWTAHDLYLPSGVYKFQFLINGELRHSDYLPTATDSFGNCVNWFEVVEGHDSIEPSRDVISSEDVKLSKDQIAVEQPAPERPALGSDGSSSSNWKGSSRHVERSGTPFSDYTGLCSRSELTKPELRHNNTSSYDLLAPVPRPKYEYTDEIPELFKANFDGSLVPPPYEERELIKDGSQKPPSFLHRVQDCNQDVLFADLQQNGQIDSQAAEEAFLQQYPTPDLPVYLDSSFLNAVFSGFQDKTDSKTRVNHIVPHVNLNHLLTSSIRDEIISVGCTTRYEGKFITQIIYTPCYYSNKDGAH